MQVSCPPPRLLPSPTPSHPRFAPMLFRAFTFYVSTLVFLFRLLISILKYLIRFSIVVTFTDTAVSLYFRLHDLSPVTVDLDDQTTVHFWTSNHRRFDRPNLVMIHGYGGDAKWQFVYQVHGLSRRFNLFVPDLVFFGKSYSHRPERTDVFQAKCLLAGLKRLGVERFSAYSISYGGYVAYRMAEMCGRAMEKVVIVSSGVGCSDDQIGERVKEFGRDPGEVLLPRTPRDLRLLVKLTAHRSQPLKWLPDFCLGELVNVLGNINRKEKVELLEELLSKKEEKITPLAVLTQETLLIWGDKDFVFPVHMAYQLQRHLGPKSRLEIIKDAGHAVNMDSPDILNDFITSFLLDLGVKKS